MKTSKETKNKLKYTLPVFLIIGMLVAVFATPIPVIPDIEEGEIRGWKSVWFGALGDLDAGGGADSQILGVWILNNSVNGYTMYGNVSTAQASPSHYANDTAWLNASVNVLGYVQADDFDIEIPHSTDFDILVRVRVNQTNAADGDWFNITWVALNLTAPSLTGQAGGINMTAAVTHNVSGDPFMYINFYYNGTIQDYAWQNTAAGTGFQIARNNRTFISSLNLMCYY